VFVPCSAGLTLSANVLLDVEDAFFWTCSFGLESFGDLHVQGVNFSVGLRTCLDATDLFGMPSIHDCCGRINCTVGHDAAGACVSQQLSPFTCLLPSSVSLALQRHTSFVEVFLFLLIIQTAGAVGTPCGAWIGA